MSPPGLRPRPPWGLYADSSCFSGQLLRTSTLKHLTRVSALGQTGRIARQAPPMQSLLLRLANICGGTGALEKTGALRQHTPTGLPFSKFPARAETPLENLYGGPCSASAVSAAGGTSSAAGGASVLLPRGLLWRFLPFKPSAALMVSGCGRKSKMALP